MARKRRRKEARQEEFAFPARHGGARKGAGRRPKGRRAGVSHRTREALAARSPVHITTRLVDGIGGLRSEGAFRIVRAALAKGNERLGFRLVHYSVMSNHLHMAVEARNRKALSRGMQGLLIRVAKALNRGLMRKGKVFADRYHARILRSPREVRAALAYVLRNAARHGLRFVGIDPFSSGGDFDGWKWIPRKGGAGPRPQRCWLARARTYLLRAGWRRHGRIDPAEAPGPG